MNRIIFFISFFALIVFTLPTCGVYKEKPVTSKSSHLPDSALEAIASWRGPVCWAPDRKKGIDCVCKAGCKESEFTLDELYDKGFETMQYYTGDDRVFLASFEYYCTAICIDPKFGPGYAGISSNIMSSSINHGPRIEVYDKEIMKLAVIWLNRAGELSPNDYRYVGSMWAYMDITWKTDLELLEARKLLDRAIELKPDEARFYRYRARRDYRQSIEGAINDLNKAMELAKTDVEKSRIWEDLSDIYAGKGEYELWENAIKESLKANPTNAWLFDGYGYSLTSIGRCEEAKKEINNALKLMNFGMAQKHLADVEECLQWQKKNGVPPEEYPKIMFTIKFKRGKYISQKYRDALVEYPDLFWIRVAYIGHMFLIKADDWVFRTLTMAKNYEKMTGNLCEANYIRYLAFLRMSDADQPNDCVKYLQDNCDMSYIYWLQSAPRVPAKQSQ